MKIKKALLPLIICSNLIMSCSSLKEGEIRYAFSHGFENDYSANAFYFDSYFDGDSTIYNASLSTCSLNFAMASFASNRTGGNYSLQANNAKDFLTSAGFNSIYTNSYFNEKPTADSLGVIYAKKTIGNYTLIASGIRGGGYGAEWASNMTVGDNDSDIKNHKGFYDSSLIYLNSLNDYINKYEIKGNIKLWSVGYSRGGAVNNVSYGFIDKKISNNEKINSNVNIKKEDVYCYCFETPMGASFLEDISPRNEIYSNIHNIINTADPVPKIPFNDFEFTRYGVDYYLPDSIRNSNYNSIIDDVISRYEDVSDHSIIGDYYISSFKVSGSDESADRLEINEGINNKINWNSGLFLDKFFSSLATLGVENLSNYVTNLQTGLRELFELLYKNGSPKFSFITLGTSFVKYLLNTTDVDIMINNLLHDTTQFIKDFLVLLNNVFTEYEFYINPNDLTNSITGLIKALAITFISNLSYFFTSINLNNIKAITSAHYCELCLSHLMNQDKNYSKNIYDYNSDGSYYYVEIDNVSEDSVVEILNSNGDIKASVFDNSLDNRSSLTCGSNGKTVYFYIPVEEEYTINIKNIYTCKVSYFDQRYKDLVEYKNITNNIVEDSIVLEAYPEKK